MSRIFIFAVFYSVSFIFSAEANTKCRAYLAGLSASPRFALDIGAPINIELEIEGTTKKIKANFLGISKYIDGTSSGAFFFDAKEKIIHFIGIGDVKFYQDTLGQQMEVPENFLAPIVRSINQQGGTCAAFAIFNCMRQLFINGDEGNGMIFHHMDSEPARLRFWERIRHDYYGDGNHRDAEHNIAKELGFKKVNINNYSPQKMAEFLREYSKAGWPFILYFDVGEAMSITPYRIYNHVTQTMADQRLWTPSTTGRGSGGHQIIGVKVFIDTQGQEWIVVVDSNWQAPRLWKIQELNNIRLGGIGGWGFSQVGPNPLPEDRPPPPVMHFGETYELKEPSEL